MDNYSQCVLTMVFDFKFMIVTVVTEQGRCGAYKITNHNQLVGFTQKFE